MAAEWNHPPPMEKMWVGIKKKKKRMNRWKASKSGLGLIVTITTLAEGLDLPDVVIQNGKRRHVQSAKGCIYATGC
jgi:hypothetical protein